MGAEHTSARLLGALQLFALLGLIACDDPSHENIEKWVHTQKGPQKLSKVLRDENLAPELRGHAAQKLIELEKFTQVKEVLSAMPASYRADVMADLVERLWSDARLRDEMAAPGPLAVGAKDSLFYLRPLAERATRDKIDDYLVEWLAGGYYEGRAGTGRAEGVAIVQAIGPKAGPRLIAATNSLLAHRGKDNARARIGNRLLNGLAACGDPKAVELLLKLMANDRGDKTLGERAMDALFQAYVEPRGIPKADASGLKPYVAELSGLVLNPSRRGLRNKAAGLIGAVGAPDCIPAFLVFINHPTARTKEGRRLLWTGVQQAARCAGAAAIVPVATALPTSLSYERGVLEKYFWQEVRQQSTRHEVAEEARKLLGEKSWIARASGVELLGSLALPQIAQQDATLIRAIAGDRTRLRGWNGDRGGAAPTLGQLASRVAKHLEEVARDKKTE